MNFIKRFFKTLLIVAVLITYCSSAFSQTQPSANVHSYNGIKTLVLTGSHYQMGIEYGQAMQHEMQKTLTILENYYTKQHHFTHQQLVNEATLLYNRFPVTYQRFLKGLSKGAKMSLNSVIVLNGMETLGELFGHHHSAHCAFLFINRNQTVSGHAFIGRNYDYPAPFDKIARYLTVTILKDKNTVPTAIIALPGEIYCPSCVNAKGLFMELNNGTPSGGKRVDTNRQSLLINLLLFMQNSHDLAQLEKQLNAAQSDFSLIVNAADKDHIKSFEYSSTSGMKHVFPKPGTNFASTNFYLSPQWNNIPKPTNATTWQGITRRNNLLHLSNKPTPFTLKQFKKLMDTPLKQGGAKWQWTIYQIIFNPNNLHLYLKHKGQKHWANIPLNSLF